jgi:hypothetical protein
MGLRVGLGPELRLTAGGMAAKFPEITLALWWVKFMSDHLGWSLD